jgi:hypothetical protein
LRAGVFSGTSGIFAAARSAKTHDAAPAIRRLHQLREKLALELDHRRKAGHGRGNRIDAFERSGKFLASGPTLFRAN